MGNAPDLLKAALGYAKRGWPVFPCSPKAGKGGKRPLVKGDIDPETGKTIPNTGGLKKATTDKATITEWWQQWPDALIGIPTGPEIGAFVIDCDPRDGETAEQVLKRLEATVGKIPAGPFSVTQSGGVHLWFRYPQDDKVGNRAGVIPHVDVRGAGGYVIAAPSVMADGKAYRWISAPRDCDYRFPPAPEKVLDAVLKRGAFGRRGAAASADRKRPADEAQARDEVVRRYAMAALGNQADQVAKAADGTRNQTLNNSALALGSMVAAGMLSEGAVIAELRAAADRAGLTKEDGSSSIDATINSGLRKGRETAFDISKIKGRGRQSARTTGAAAPLGGSARSGGSGGDGPLKGGGGMPPVDDGAAEVMDKRLAFHPLTDLGNAERFRDRFLGRLLWCPALGWLYWDGRRWAREGAEERVKAAEHETARCIQNEAAAITGTSADYAYENSRGKQVVFSDTLKGWGRTSEGAAKLGAMGKRAQAYLHVSTSQLDADPWKLNVLNGTLTINPHAGADEPYISIAPHDPHDFITKIAPVDYDPAAQRPEFDRFIGEVQPSANMGRFLAQWHGINMVGDTSIQALCVFWGKGRNGKSTLVDVVAHVLGDYSETVPIETFLTEGRGRNAGAATPDLAILPGVRHLRTSEPDRGAKLSEALIKLATGGEPMQVRHLNRDYFKFYPEFKLTISGNYRPTIQGTDEGIWRRVMLVPWVFQVAKEDVDPDLGEKLRAEGSGILNWGLDGLCDFLDNGLVRPDEVNEATQEYRTDSDPMGRFLDACVVLEPGQRVQSSVMYEVFKAWARANGEREWSNKGMSAALRERGFHSKHSDVNWWVDVKLIRGVSDFVDFEGNPLRERPPDRGGGEADFDV